MFISKIPKFSTPLPFIVKEIFQIKNHAKRIASLTLSRRIASLTLSFTLPKKFSSISGGPTLPCSFNKQVRCKYFSNSLGKPVWVFNPITLCEATILLSLPLPQWVWLRLYPKVIHTHGWELKIPWWYSWVSGSKQFAFYTQFLLFFKPDQISTAGHFISSLEE